MPTPTIIQQSTNGGGGGASLNVSLSSSNTVPGNAILVTILQRPNSGGVLITSVTDSEGNTYTQLKSSTDGGGDQNASFIATGIVGGTHPTVTCHTNAGTASINMTVAEVSNLASVPKDKEAAGTGSSTTMDSGATPATTQAVELVIGYGGTPSAGPPTFTPGAGYTLLDQGIFGGFNGINSFTEYLVTSGTGVQDATATKTGGDPWLFDCVTLKSGGGPPPVAARPQVSILQ